ncbi:TonB-dependent receptor domain-containing protein [Spirosoma endophyticum]|uniref:Outer membrane receptor proteins, mostly Fe transport n=1 Tax=Spirosoma endophyticum TaxID=662367 RepID=A0A1I1RJN4_9BACT|nr:TonB-dependent receptor [Spirosoma endophyticum]SFD34526.1 Outer membrane receptor proteins, mostly Fe transport [Spirosoma endophyticum]
MKNLFLLVVLCLFSAALCAQNPPLTRFTLQGRAVDTASAPLASSTVMLLSAKDSSLVNFTRTNDTGTFSFKNIKAGNYVLKISFVGFIPYNQVIKPTGDAVVDLGELKMKPITRELMEVVVRTAKAPLTIKGDTIEYNASSFKVPPGSTVEDLLRKLPGVQVDQDGNIRAQGQEVKKVTVDGKSFFGDDPKLATKNIQAEAITKVQVFNDKTEQAKLTGIDDGKKEKTVNLELKEEFKKGGFGKVTAGAGPASNNVSTRYEGKGSYNKFNSKRQFSALLLGNNSNQQGLSFNDYQDFRGSNSFNWNDNADFGFSGYTQYISFGDDNESLTIPISGGNGRGFSRNMAGGLNYNYDTKTTKLSTSYYFNQTRLQLDALRNNKRYLPGSTVLSTTDTSNQANLNTNHRVSLRFEKQLDSLQTLIVISNGRFGFSSSDLQSTQRVFQNVAATNEVPTTLSRTLNNSSANQFNMANTLLYRLKFKKKGRSFGASATYQINKNDGDLLLKARNEFFQATNVNDMLRVLNQDQGTNSLSNQYKANLLYAEPFAKKFFWETFYNFNLRYDEVDRDVANLDDSRRQIDSLSLYYKNNYLFNRLGSSIRYSFKGLNISAGLAGQQFQLDGKFARDQTQPLQSIRRTYTTVIPNIGLNYSMKNNRSLGAGYNVGVQIPSSRDLQPVSTNTNPLYITQGNPDLLPQLNHNINLSFNYFNPGSFITFWSNIYGTYYVNQIVYSQTYDPQTLIQTTMPENLTGGRNLGTYLYFGFPLKKTKATLNLNTQLNFGHNLTRINKILNETNNENYTVGARLELTPKDWFTFYGNANVSVGNTRYSINTTQNQTIYNNSFRGDLNLKLPGSIYLNTSLNYSVYKNEKLGFNQQIPILNSSLYHILGKAKKAEIRLSAYDLLNRNVVVSQYAGQNYTNTERIQSLARYFLLSFTYNMRGVQDKMRRDGY